MVALLKAAIEFERSHATEGARWNDEHGAPLASVAAREAFLAGAAAMAEILASGQTLKIEPAPRRYFVRFVGYLEGDIHKRRRISYILWAYDSLEAERQAYFRYCGIRPESHQGLSAEIRPALDTDQEEEHEIV